MERLSGIFLTKHVRGIRRAERAPLLHRPSLCTIPPPASLSRAQPRFTCPNACFGNGGQSNKTACFNSEMACIISRQSNRLGLINLILRIPGMRGAYVQERPTPKWPHEKRGKANGSVSCWRAPLHEKEGPRVRVPKWSAGDTKSYMVRETPQTSDPRAVGWQSGWQCPELPSPHGTRRAPHKRSPQQQRQSRPCIRQRKQQLQTRTGSQCDKPLPSLQPRP